ncbi:type II toxin-antitoxin system Phd/YefM family antitoxin [Glycomyces salinus]|uniref:type II toxin-antitoxin system Phd/YefM family antitoxin n=1 Tax=Glycomyces salinus TaxID=980294 RepID=UPI0018EA6439|nr:type II toxin-antitoxin system prevent-host-death family antitoxin [Glycomyces salinus]
MKAITFSEAKAEYDKTLDAVVDDQEEVIVTREEGRSVVIMPLSEYESLMETAYLMSSPANARRLLASIEELENGKGVVRELIE